VVQLWTRRRIKLRHELVLVEIRHMGHLTPAASASYTYSETVLAISRPRGRSDAASTPASTGAAFLDLSYGQPRLRQSVSCPTVPVERTAGGGVQRALNSGSGNADRGSGIASLSIGISPGDARRSIRGSGSLNRDTRWVSGAATLSGGMPCHQPRISHEVSLPGQRQCASP
jgi:hypothetical protein